MKPDENYKQFATDKQWEYYEKYCELGGFRAVAKELGVHYSTVAKSYTTLMTKAARSGYAPDHDVKHIAPPGYGIKGTSTLYNGEGEVTSQWVKTEVDAVDFEAKIREAIEVLSQEVDGLAKSMHINAELDDQLMSVYPVTDAHVGLLAWGQETGEDQDLNIISDVLIDGFNRVCSSQPSSEQAIIAFMGDYFHADNDDKVTRRSGNSLDVDGRCDKVFARGVHIARCIIEIARLKHGEIHVIVLPGNHDDYLSMAMRHVLRAYYSECDNVLVKNIHGVFAYHEFGQTLMAFHHGHTTKMKDMPAVIANDQREAWGRTKFSHAFTGHFHTESVMDIGGCKVERFRAPCAKDAWTHESGYRSPRSMYGITFDKERGEVGRSQVNIIQVKDHDTK